MHCMWRKYRDFCCHYEIDFNDDNAVVIKITIVVVIIIIIIKSERHDNVIV